MKRLGRCVFYSPSSGSQERFITFLDLKMPLKNYTTKVPADRSINEIQAMLVKHGASGILFEYEQGTGRIAALKFVLNLEGNKIPFSLPVNWRLFQAVLKKDRVKRWGEDDYCYSVAWRDIRDWIDAQLAIYETQMVSLPQLFLPYAVTKTGQTFYEQVAGNPSVLLLSESPKDEPL